MLEGEWSDWWLCIAAAPAVVVHIAIMARMAAASRKEARQALASALSKQEVDAAESARAAATRRANAECASCCKAFSHALCLVVALLFVAQLTISIVTSELDSESLAMRLLPRVAILYLANLTCHAVLIYGGSSLACGADTGEKEATACGEWSLGIAYVIVMCQAAFSVVAFPAFTHLRVIVAVMCLVLGVAHGNFVLTVLLNSLLSAAVAAEEIVHRPELAAMKIVNEALTLLGVCGLALFLRSRERALQQAPRPEAKQKTSEVPDAEFPDAETTGTNSAGIADLREFLSTWSPDSTRLEFAATGTDLSLDGTEDDDIGRILSGDSGQHSNRSFNFGNNGTPHRVERQSLPEKTRHRTRSARRRELEGRGFSAAKAARMLRERAAEPHSGRGELVAPGYLKTSRTAKEVSTLALIMSWNYPRSSRHTCCLYHSALAELAYTVKGLKMCGCNESIVPSTSAPQCPSCGILDADLSEDGRQCVVCDPSMSRGGEVEISPVSL